MHCHPGRINSNQIIKSAVLPFLRCNPWLEQRPTMALGEGVCDVALVHALFWSLPFIFAT